jgi:hypothetical protein
MKGETNQDAPHMVRLPNIPIGSLVHPIRLKKKIIDDRDIKTSLYKSIEADWLFNIVLLMKTVKIN